MPEPGCQCRAYLEKWCATPLVSCKCENSAPTPTQTSHNCHIGPSRYDKKMYAVIGTVTNRKKMRKAIGPIFAPFRPRTSNGCLSYERSLALKNVSKIVFFQNLEMLWQTPIVDAWSHQILSPRWWLTCLKDQDCVRLFPWLFSILQTLFQVYFEGGPWFEKSSCVFLAQLCNQIWSAVLVNPDN